MAYSDFTLEQVIEQFELSLTSVAFPLQAIVPSQALSELLQRYLSLATSISTEKARNELIVAPILLEVRTLLHDQIGYFSGRMLTVDASVGLNGECDFLLSADANQTLVQAPIVVVVEAKNADLSGGLGQCAAQMLGAWRFNARKGKSQQIYGAVTTGTNWRLLTLVDNQLQISLEEYLVPPQLPLILGFLSAPFQNN
jgi:hypothetical protein